MTAIPKKYTRSSQMHGAKRIYISQAPEAASSFSCTANPRMAFRLPVIPGAVLDMSETALKFINTFSGYATSNNFTNQFSVISSIDIYCNGILLPNTTANQYAAWWATYRNRTAEYKLENAVEQLLLQGVSETEATRDGLSGKQFYLKLADKFDIFDSVWPTHANNFEIVFNLQQNLANVMTAIGTVGVLASTLTNVTLDLVYVQSPALMSYVAQPISHYIDNIYSSTQTCAASLTSFSLNYPLPQGILKAMICFPYETTASALSLSAPTRLGKQTSMLSAYITSFSIVFNGQIYPASGPIVCGSANTSQGNYRELQRFSKSVFGSKVSSLLTAINTTDNVLCYTFGESDDTASGLHLDQSNNNFTLQVNTCTSSTATTFLTFFVYQNVVTFGGAAPMRIL